VNNVAPFIATYLVLLAANPNFSQFYFSIVPIFGKPLERFGNQNVPIVNFVPYQTTSGKNGIIAQNDKL
jgi:hypothetical protein